MPPRPHAAYVDAEVLARAENAAVHLGLGFARPGKKSRGLSPLMHNAVTEYIAVLESPEGQPSVDEMAAEVRAAVDTLEARLHARKDVSSHGN